MGFSDQLTAAVKLESRNAFLPSDIEADMPGLLHIFRLDPEHQPFNKLEPQYQANYETPGNNYAGAYTEAQLKETLLHSALGFDDARIHDIISELHRTGKFTIADVEIPIPETGVLGLEQQPSDF